MTRVDEMRAPPKRRFSLAHPVPPAQGEYRYVYLWQWPIRAMHWIAAASIVALVITNFRSGRRAKSSLRCPSRKSMFRLRSCASSI